MHEMSTVREVVHDIWVRPRKYPLLDDCCTCVDAMATSGSHVTKASFLCTVGLKVAGGRRVPGFISLIYTGWGLYFIFLLCAIFGACLLGE